MRYFRDKQCFQHCRNCFEITSVSTDVEIFVQIFLFINALQAPTCWSCLKPEFMKLCRYLGDKYIYFNVPLKNVMVFLIFPLEAAPSIFSVVFWILRGAPSKDLLWNVTNKENSKCFETAHDFWEIKGIPSRIPHGQTNLGHCCDANSAQHIPVSPSTSHGIACTGTTDKNHTESTTQLLQTLPFHPGSIWNPPQDTYSHIEDIF